MDWGVLIIVDLGMICLGIMFVMSMDRKFVCKDGKVIIVIKVCINLWY